MNMNGQHGQGRDYRTMLKGGVTATIIRGENALWTLKAGDFSREFVNRRDALEMLRRIAGTRRTR